jgi:N-acetylmuramoyl-L-alanine amidase
MRLAHRNLLFTGLAVLTAGLAGAGAAKEAQAPQILVSTAAIPQSSTIVTAAQPALDLASPDAAPATADQKPSAAKQNKISSDTATLDRETECMAKVVRYEAGNQSRTGQEAIAKVVLNRTKSGRFPKTICGVVYQPGQFHKIASFAPARNTA